MINAISALCKKISLQIMKYTFIITAILIFGITEIGYTQSKGYLRVEEVVEKKEPEMIEVEIAENLKNGILQGNGQIFFDSKIINYTYTYEPNTDLLEYEFTF